MNSFLNVLLHFGIGFLFARVWSSVGQGSRLGFLLHCWFGVLIGLGANALLNLFRSLLGSTTSTVSLQTSSIIIGGSVFEAFVFGLLFAPKHLDTPLSNPSSKPISRMPSNSNPLSSSTNALTNSSSSVPQPSVSAKEITSPKLDVVASDSTPGCMWIELNEDNFFFYYWQFNYIFRFSNQKDFNQESFVRKRCCKIGQKNQKPRIRQWKHNFINNHQEEEEGFEPRKIREWRRFHNILC